MGENNKHVICRPRSARIGKTVPSVLGTQDLWHSFSQYGPPGRQITYIYITEPRAKKTAKTGVKLQITR